LSPEQLGAIRSGVTVVASWVLATDDPSEELLRATRREDPTALVIGLASAARLLTVELSIATCRAEHEVLANLWRTISREPHLPGHPAHGEAVRSA
jgi:hypothetical protein